MLIVQKFGGSSVANAERIRRVAGIIAAAHAVGDSPVVVLSARGDTTDALLDNAGEITKKPQRRELDVLLSTGELGSVALMAMQLHSMGLDCVSLSGRQAGIFTDCVHGSARILNISTDRLHRELKAGKIVLVAGFQGVNENDDVTTLGRGGSDTTAVALADALGASRCEIYSDVDGVYTADPRLVTGAKKLDRIDYADMLHLALGGSQVLHSRAVEAAIAGNVELTLLSSFTRRAGTVVSKFDERPPICGVTRDKAASKISVVGQRVDAQTLAETVALLADSGIVVGEGELSDGVCAVTVSAENVLPSLELIHRHFFN